MARFVIGNDPSLEAALNSAGSRLSSVAISNFSSVVESTNNVISGRQSLSDAINDNRFLNSDIVSLFGSGNRRSDSKYRTPYGQASYHYVALRRRVVEEVAPDGPDSFGDIFQNQSILGSEGFNFNENQLNERPQATRVESVQEFVDHNALVKVSRKKNIIMTKVEGRDFSRKEFVSGGDYMITISGRVCSHRDGVYPEEEVQNLIQILNDDGVISIEHQLLNRFNINGIIVLDYSMNEVRGMSNIQDYTINAVFERPLEVIAAEQVNEEGNIQNILRRVNDVINVSLSSSNLISNITL